MFYYILYKIGILHASNNLSKQQLDGLIMSIDANRVKQVKPSPTLAVAAKATEMRAQGMDMINLAPVSLILTPHNTSKTQPLLQLHAGFTKYTAVDGIPELKQAFVTNLNEIMIWTIN